jgi:glycosyltransferase involved in cell wall biosynthesis
MLNVLSVGYRLAPVAAHAVGGAEQVLGALDRALMAAGHVSVVLACSGSSVAGELCVVDIGDGPLTDEFRARATILFRERLERLIQERRFDVVHFHGMDVGDYPLDAPWLRDVPKLVTLHVPLEWYPASLFQTPGNVNFNSVSDWHGTRLGASSFVRASIPNGVDLSAWYPEPRPHGAHVACLGRICHEKGFDIALRAAHAAALPLMLAGHTFGYAEHERYFSEDIAPLLDDQRRFVGRVQGENKRRMLAHACALVVPSRVAETCSLVTLEALACGTPVIVPRAGAPATLIEDGVTGWVADGDAEITAALGRLSQLDRAACRRRAERFDQREMLRRYFALYAELSQSAPGPASRQAQERRLARG